MAALDQPEPKADPYPAVLLRAVVWLVVLAPFFYLSYGFANWLASLRNDVPSIVFSWEWSIPFLAWTIVPYWSINLFYALSLAWNDTKRDVDRLALRYLTAQAVAVSCFILFPLTAIFVRPETTGLPGFMFAVLGGFDKPFNQAPSLHIALLVTIWDHWRHRLGGPLLWIWHVWCLLIGLSVLTTWQHHFIDIPTGALLGLFALWLFPPRGEAPFDSARFAGEGKAWRLAFLYACGAAIFLVGSILGAYRSPVWLVLLWPSLALAIVAGGYTAFGAQIFQKDVDGRVSLASRLLLWPYRIGARFNVWAWTRNLPDFVEIADGVHLGRFPGGTETGEFATVVDLAAEFERPRTAESNWISIALLDLVAPDRDLLAVAAEVIENARASGPVLVCCALGFQRSAAAVAAWLVDTGRADSLEQAGDMLAASGRPVHLHGPTSEAATA